MSFGLALFLRKLVLKLNKKALLFQLAFLFVTEALNNLFMLNFYALYSFF